MYPPYDQPETPSLVSSTKPLALTASTAAITSRPGPAPASLLMPRWNSPPEVVAAAIVRLQHQPALGRHELRARAERHERRRARPAVDQQHHRVLLRRREIRRIRQNRVLFVVVVLERHDLRLAERIDAISSFTIVSRLHRRSRRRHVIQLARPGRRRAGKRDRAVLADRHVHEERRVRTRVAGVELLRRCRRAAAARATRVRCRSRRR